MRSSPALRRGRAPSVLATRHGAAKLKSATLEASAWRAVRYRAKSVRIRNNGKAAEMGERYEIKKLPGSGRYYLFDAHMKRDVHRAWPQHRKLRTWASEAAARKAIKGLDCGASYAAANDLPAD